ncbi:cytochrome c oxidase assembly protein CtaG [Roseibium aquae]|uniref:Cytochrome c oxidase assembly protein CtaG n=1 Tax=Roseibium aquae TaxID=1323746 RepID=A0A916TN92_9HYPH|nr:cytochrome c oxidase assembly protein [Roseibium aquae]GGB52319.1 cytochrome c oxidase assembly protein CtaG [Roseibium aquae]
MSEQNDQSPKGNTQNLKVALACTGMFCFMIGAAYAAVPLYDLFCRVTGFGGTTQVAETASEEVIDRMVTVRFDGNINRSLPWEFGPEKRSVTLKMGEMGEMLYFATNVGENATVGTSTFNVTPLSAGAYFNKLDCFCFTEQPLEVGETAEMPVVFFVDPAMNDDPQLAHVKEITLSYTFFPVHEPTAPLAARAGAPDEEPKTNL